MKKLIIIAAIFTVGCSDDDFPISSQIDGIGVSVIDGCEYLKNPIWDGNRLHYWYVYTHKGNCSNKIHCK